jgi:hypothetical protein
MTASHMQSRCPLISSQRFMPHLPMVGAENGRRGFGRTGIQLPIGERAGATASEG